MQSSTDANARRPVIIYIIVAVVLFAALILGLRWAKSRSAYYAQQQSGQSQPVAETGGHQATTPSTQEPEQPAPAPPPAPSSSNTASNTPAVPSHVPSTGPEQFILPIISLSLVTFSATSYVRARKRLQSVPQIG